jgi:lipopolysaccharide export LptBFGC system permease protein LptF
VIPILGAIAAPILSMLANKGLSLLSDVAGSVTDAGVKKLTDFVEDKTGIDITDAHQVAALTPEQVVELKRLEIEHAQYLISIHMTDRRMTLEDRANARELQKSALKQEDRFSKRFVYVLATLFMVLSFGYATAVTFIELPESQSTVANVFLGGVITTGLGGIFNFFFGSSKGSKDKSEKLEEVK